MEELLNSELKITRFNVRVYGIVINSAHRVLLCRENHAGMEMTKFPGGGLELGEGPIQCLHREFKEELDIDIEILDHFYTTGFFQQSAFIKTDQIISIYYKVKFKGEKDFDGIIKRNGIEFFWEEINESTENKIKFPIDKYVLKLLL